MRIDTIFGPMETRRTVTPSTDPATIIIGETFTLPMGFRGTREGRAQVQVDRAMYDRDPLVADQSLRRALEGTVAEREAVVEVGTQVGLVPRPRLDLGGYLPPHYVADDLVAANREVPRRPQAAGGVTRVPRRDNPNAINIMAGAFTNVGTFTNGETFNIGWTAGGDATVNPREPAPPLREKKLCSCGHPDDPNWEHAHNECTFLDRPASEFYDDGAV